MAGKPVVSDTLLIARAREGDASAFSELVKRYEQTVYGFAYKVCRDREKAEETLQDTLINVFRNLHQFEGKSKFSTWLYTIVSNNCLMKRRRRKLDQEMISLDMPLSHENPETALALEEWKQTPSEMLLSAELRDHLDNAIKKLPVDYRVVFVLRDLEGQTAEETAEILKLSVPAVKSRLRRARVFLRNKLHDYMVR